MSLLLCHGQGTSCRCDLGWNLGNVEAAGLALAVAAAQGCAGALQGPGDAELEECGDKVTPGVGSAGLGLSLAQEKVQSRAGQGSCCQLGGGDRSPCQGPRCGATSQGGAVPVGMAHWAPPGVFRVWTRV